MGEWTLGVPPVFSWLLTLHKYLLSVKPAPHLPLPGPRKSLPIRSMHFSDLDLSSLVWPFTLNLNSVGSFWHWRRFSPSFQLTPALCRTFLQFKNLELSWVKHWEQGIHRHSLWPQGGFIHPHWGRTIHGESGGHWYDGRSSVPTWLGFGMHKYLVKPYSGCVC